MALLFSTRSTVIVHEYSELRRVLGTVTLVASDSLRPSNIDFALEEHRSRTIARSNFDSTGKVSRWMEEGADPNRPEASRMPSTKTGMTGVRNAKLLRLRELGDTRSQTL